MLLEFQTLFPGLSDIMDSVYRGWTGGRGDEVDGGGGWGAEGGFLHTFDRKAAIVYSLKCTNSHSSLVRPIRFLVEV